MTARARHRVCSQQMRVLVILGRNGDCGTSLKTGKFHHKIESSPDNLGDGACRVGATFRLIRSCRRFVEHNKTV